MQSDAHSIGMFIILTLHLRSYQQRYITNISLMRLYHTSKKKKRNELKNPEARAILIVDGLKSHNNTLINSALAMHHIEYLMMPAHSSHILQPLDRYFFHATKQAYARIRKRSDIDSVTANLERIYISIQTASITANILRSWDHAGIVPIIEEGYVTRVTFEASKLDKHTSSLFNEKTAESEDAIIEEESTSKKRKRISEKNCEWGFINEEHMCMLKQGNCPFCHHKIDMSSDLTGNK